VKKIVPVFATAVSEYLNAISVDYNSRQGDDPTREVFKNRVISLFRHLPASFDKTNHLLFVFISLLEPAEDSRLSDWRRDLALELAKELQKKI
jgi:hypothetical protein